MIEEKEKKAPPHRWKKGQSGNPKGRPPDEACWAGVIRRALEEQAGSSKMSKKEAIVRVLLSSASKGDINAIKMLMDRTDGLPTAKVEQSGETRIVIEEEIIER